MAIRLPLTVAVMAAAAACAGSGGATVGGRLLVVAYVPAHPSSVAHAYDLKGRLLATVKSPVPQGSLTWSPDGSRLAIANRTGLWVERANGTGLRRLVTTKTSCTSACLGAPVVAWTPDGQRLAVGGVDPHTTGVVMIQVATGRTTRLRPPRPYVFYTPIAFSTDGRWLSEAVSNGDAGTASCCGEALVVTEANGTHARTLFRFRDAIHDGPGAATWSPNSSEIAFTDDGRDPHDPRLAIVDVGTGHVRALDPHSVYDQPPAWSPDGKSLALTQSQGPVFTIRSDGSGFQALGVSGTIAVWLPSGDLVVASGSTGHALDLVAPGQTQARTLITLPGQEQALTVHESR